ncbi:hypothetical protein B6N60_02738 [Richelia sinica FACHB-800]|uniref:Uncharacterized protein n=1 Tax=Richelia sinica FACHB-800 TaxID=1357546 RepID=A0A975T8U0_9NOST|nr:hypothetical protein [Richelia sinica]MBD2667206.1 hypothetical protein [Richelia sinica FACHB-800]QXE24035.1 hypothetical protein B6N60_02738 [Richelia sinica FACHB-800]
MQKQHENEIFSVHLSRNLSTQGSDYIINESTVISTSLWFPSLKQIEKVISNLHISTYENFLLANQEVSYLANILNDEFLPMLVSKDDADILMRQDEHRWNIYHYFSRVGFSSNYQQALLYHSMYCFAGVPQCGTIYYFTYHQDTWSAAGSVGVFNQ